MKNFRVIVLALGVIHALFAGFTALVGGFADGGSVWERLILMAVHPIAAAALLYVVVLHTPARQIVIAASALMVINVIADVTLALLIQTGNIRGDWLLPLVFSVVPIIGLVYALTLLSHRKAADPQP